MWRQYKLTYAHGSFLSRVVYCINVFVPFFSGYRVKATKPVCSVSVSLCVCVCSESLYEHLCGEWHMNESNDIVPRANVAFLEHYNFFACFSQISPEFSLCFDSISLSNKIQCISFRNSKQSFSSRLLSVHFKSDLGKRVSWWMARQTIEAAHSRKNKHQKFPRKNHFNLHVSSRHKAHNISYKWKGNEYNFAHSSVSKFQLGFRNTHTHTHT